MLDRPAANPNSAAQEMLFNLSSVAIKWNASIFSNRVFWLQLNYSWNQNSFLKRNSECFCVVCRRTVKN